MQSVESYVHAIWWIFILMIIMFHRLLEVEHPAAKVLVELAQLQDEEVGDGTTSVVIIAAELLKVTIYLYL